MSDSNTPPGDPFAPEPESELSLELDDGFELDRRRRRATLRPHKEFISEAKRDLGQDEPKGYAERQRGVRQQYWTLTRIPVLLLLGWFTLSHLALDAQWVFIDGVNLLFHEAGHPLFRWGGDTMHALGGTLCQLMWPAGLALYFGLRRHERFSATVCLWWFGENFINIARYMHDAPVEELPLVGGDTHDWVYLFNKWDMIRQARDVADIVRSVGTIIMVATFVYLVWMTIRPSNRELAQGFTAP